MQKPQRLVSKAFGKRAHVENQLAVGGTFDRRAKVEPASLRSDTACRIADNESVGALVDDQIRQRRLVGAPVAIPDDVGDGAQHLDTAMADGAQIAVDEVRAERAGAQADWLGLDRGCAMEEEGIRGHLSKASSCTGSPLAAPA